MTKYEPHWGLCHPTADEASCPWCNKSNDMNPSKNLLEEKTKHLENKSNSIFLCLDLELNQPSRKIIEIGICIGDIQTKEEICRNTWLINPNEPINPDITKLTGISEDLIQNCGYTLDDAVAQLAEKQKFYNPFMNPVTWGQGDKDCLESQIKDCPTKPLFGRREIDVKTLFIGYCLANGLKTQSGLAKSMARVGLNFQGRKHRASDDAYNTFRMFLRMLELFQVLQK